MQGGKPKLDTVTFVFDHFNDRDFEMKNAAQQKINRRSRCKRIALQQGQAGPDLRHRRKGRNQVRNAAPGSTLIALNRVAAKLQKVVKNEVIDIKIPTVNLVAVLKDIEELGELSAGAGGGFAGKLKEPGAASRGSQRQRRPPWHERRNPPDLRGE